MSKSSAIIRTPASRELFALRKIAAAAIALIGTSDASAAERGWSVSVSPGSYLRLKRAVEEFSTPPDFDRADNEVPVVDPRGDGE